MVIGSASGAEEGAEPAKLDCGTDKEGVKDAFHQFTAILRAGDEASVRYVLEDGRHFGWIYAGRKKKNGKARTIFHEQQPNPAARAIAARGGLPVEIKDFFSVQEPGRWSGAGVRGTWGRRHFLGKTQLNCNKGEATVLSLSVKRNRDR